MLKIHRLVSKSNLYISYELIDLRLIETSSVTLYKSIKKRNKYKIVCKNIKAINVPMDSAKLGQNSNDTTAVPVDLFNNTSSNKSSLNSLQNSNPTQQLNSPRKLSQDRVYSEYRQWEDTDLGSEISKMSSFRQNGQSFTLMSYNILAQNLLELHPYLYAYHRPDALNWDFRLKNLKNEISIVKPEILCLQEVQKDHLYMILDSLKHLEFDHVFKKKTGIRNDGCAILYNRNLFTLMERHSVEYYQPGIERLDRENVAIIAKLCLKSNPSACFVVATTHLLYNPRRQDVRLAQIQVLLAELDRICINGFHPNNQPKRLPIILTGDFNLKPYSAPYQLLANGIIYYYNLTPLHLDEANGSDSRIVGKEFLSPRLGITDNCQHIDIIKNMYQGHSRLRNSELDGLFTGNATTQKPPSSSEQNKENSTEEQIHLFSSGRLTHNLNFTSVYMHRKPNGQKEGTTFQEKWITVDYIFYSKHFSPSMDSSCEGYLKLLSRYNLPTVDQCHAMGKIPNLKLGSDHLALAAKFFLQAPKS